MLDIVNPISIKENIEYAGRIYQNRNDGMYYALDAIPGTINDYTFGNNYSKRLQENGSLGIAEYNSYLGTPSGNYRIRNPFTGLDEIFWSKQ